MFGFPAWLIFGTKIGHLKCKCVNDESRDEKSQSYIEESSGHTGMCQVICNIFAIFLLIDSPSKHAAHLFDFLRTYIVNGFRKSGLEHPKKIWIT